MFVAIGWLSLSTAYAQNPAPDDSAQPNTEHERPALPWKRGPTPIELGHGAKIDLPEGYQFLGQPQAGELMKKMGNLHNDNLLGLVVPTSEDKTYFVTVRYDEEGYIKDDDKLDGDEILKSIREGEDAYNEERKKAGFPAIHAEGWKEVPHYDQGHHHVVWGLLVRDSEGSSVNYSTRVLGRKGFISINLVTEVDKLSQDKPAAATLLSATSFGGGSRYEDFNSSTDKVAEYGLTGLVLGGAGLGVAKLVKIGLLAKFGKVILAALIAGKKAVVAMLAAGGLALKKFFGGRKDQREV